jgi:hypothetical protein
MKTVILLSLLFSFIFAGCTRKTQIIFKDKMVCIEQQKLERLEPVKIRIHNQDIDVAIAYKASNDSNLEFYENQVNRNNIFCKEKK